MRGTYQGVECRTGEVRLDGKMEKAFIYVDRPGENDEQALAAAGFADLENGLWVKKLTVAEYRGFVEEFEQMEKQAAQQKIAESQLDNEKKIKAEQQRHAYNERMSQRRAQMHMLKLSFGGAALFGVIVSLLLIYVSLVYRSGTEMKTLALPLWASLTFMPIIMVGSLAAMLKRIPELYLAMAGVLVIAALAAWDTASIWLVIIAAAFVAFYFLTRKISAFKKEPEYPNYPYDGSEDTDE